jgi:PilZ domain
MNERRKIKANEFIKDIRSGMNNAALMKKYRLSSDGIQTLMQRLLDAKAMTKKELQDRLQPEGAVGGAKGSRASERVYLDLPLTIYDAEHTAIRGTVLDLTEQGLRVVGIESKVDETRKFSIFADEFIGISPLNLEVVCRWVNNEDEPDSLVAGFEILELPGRSLIGLKKLVRIMNFDA